MATQDLQGQTVKVELPENATYLWKKVDGGVGWVASVEMHYDASTDTYYYGVLEGTQINFYKATQSQINKVKNRKRCFREDIYSTGKI